MIGAGYKMIKSVLFFIILLFLSGLAGDVPAQELTLVPAGAKKRVLVPAQDIGDAWRSDLAFDVSGWTLCQGEPGGIGYEKGSGYESYITLDVGDKMYGAGTGLNSTCYICIPFTINAADYARISTLQLSIYCDDGFITYLNGSKVAEDNAPAALAWNSTAINAIESSGPLSLDLTQYLSALQPGDNLLAIHGLNASTSSSDFLILPELLASTSTNTRLCINEFMASNVLAEESADGEYDDWIEIYNPGDSVVDLAGHYMSDYSDSNRYWKIPGGQSSKTTVPALGYLILYADSQPQKGADHLGFKLGSSGGEILLISPDGITLLDRIPYQYQFRDVSFGRFPNGGSQWDYFSNATPGLANHQGHTDFVLPPIVDHLSGYYGNLTISAQPGQARDSIRYTLDGSEPIRTSSLYIDPVRIDQTTVFKARSFNGDALPSQAVVRAFLFDEHSLPVLVLITDPKNLFDPETGIYRNDGDGRSWERFGELAYFKDRELAFQIPAGLRIQGNSGPEDFEKKAFRAYFRKGYGDERLIFPLFPGNDVSTFARLILRSGYDDSMEPTTGGEHGIGTLIRDPLVSRLWRECSGLASQSQYAVLYLNDVYHGIYDIKESIDENFIKDHTGYADVDIMRTRWDSLELVYGSRDKWQELVDFFENNTFAGDAKLAEAGRLFDLDNFTNLQALVQATEFRSWAYGTFMYRQKSAEGKWLWTVWDADRALTDLNRNGFTTRSNLIDQYLNDLITIKLLQNQTFRTNFINRIADLLNTVFVPEHVKSIIDSLALSIEPEMPAEVAKWNNTVETWHANLDALHDFAERRPDVVRQQMQDYFALPAQFSLNLSLAGGKGTFKVNSVMIDRFPWNGRYYQNIPITLTAIAEPGYRFKEWTDSSLAKDETITLNLSKDTSIEAVFEPLRSANIELIAPSRIKAGQHLPLVVRLRDQNWDINPIDQTPMTVSFADAHADTLLPIKRGAGTGVFEINSASGFSLSVQNSTVNPVLKQIKISSTPTISYSGTLPSGEVVWDSTADRLISFHLTIPSDCHLTIKAGTWVLLKKYVNFYVQGSIVVEGSAEEPVVIAPDNWSEPWGGLEFIGAVASFRYCMVVNGGGDLSQGSPTNDGWHTGHQHIFFGRSDSDFNFDQCFFLHSSGKVFGVQDSKVTITNSVTSFVWHGGEFHRVLLKYQDSHLMNLPNDDHIYTEDIDTDGLHIDYVNPQYPQYSEINRCYFVTGKDDAIDQDYSRLKIANCWLEDFIHEGVAASAGDTVKIFNTVAIGNDQGFEAGWTATDAAKGPFVFIDHCVSVDNNVGLRIGDSYSNQYRNFMKVTNTVVYNNRDNVWNYLNTTHAPLEGALDISYSMVNDSDYDNSPHCITGVPQFDPYYYLLPGSPGANMGTRASNMGRVDSLVINAGSVVINEIMYNAPSEMDSKDWIELYNPRSTSQDISAWILADDDNTHSFTIPQGAIIPAGGYRVLCADTSAFRASYSYIENSIGNISFGFGGNDQVRLFTPAGMLVDSVAYDNNTPWPVGADGNGYSLELINPDAEHSSPANWDQSRQFGGSPGKPNEATDAKMHPVTTLPGKFVLEQNYPNPFNPRTQIRYYLPKPGLVRITVFDVLGQQVLDLDDGNQPRQAGQHTVEMDGTAMPSGIFFYQILYTDETGIKKSQFKKMLLIK
jgi:hypothetical protein